MSDSFIEAIPSELLSALLDNPYESQILVDKDGIVRFLSSYNEAFYGTTRSEAIGRHILDLNPDSELGRVLETGKAEIGRFFQFQGHERFIARLPLRDPQGNIVGVAGKLMFRDAETVRNLMRQIEIMESKLSYYEQELRQVHRRRYTLDRFVGESKLMQEAKKAAAQAASSDMPVLISGETGTGKEVLAHAIHQLSRRRDRPLVCVNCASIPQELFESELFGYEAGAFTGASPRGKPGKFELADKGTIFLDEVGELPLPMQVKLLRVIQDRVVERVGGRKPVRLDFRVLAATNRDLKKMMARGEFRKDLYYRLNIFSIHVPPLRETRADIPRLAYHLLSLLRKDHRDAPRRIDPQAMKCLESFDWPGNVRELQNVVERASVLAGEGPILAEHLPEEVRAHEAAMMLEDPRTLREEVAAAERSAIQRALGLAEGNRSEAARLLGIHRTGLYQKMRRHGVDGR
ncbi:MAG: AAA family ATPase [Deltaproteobacteria bacterium]|nr:AAA family ATPase [Deltaproteobacteria bacterium]